jgi:hypothetical protein
VAGENCFDAAVAIDSSAYLVRKEWFRLLKSLLRPGGRVFNIDCCLGGMNMRNLSIFTGTRVSERATSTWLQRGRHVCELTILRTSRFRALVLFGRRPIERAIGFAITSSSASSQYLAGLLCSTPPRALSKCAATKMRAARADFGWVESGFPGRVRIVDVTLGSVRRGEHKVN